MKTMTPDEREFIRKAHHFLERDSILIRIANLAGKPLGLLQKTLPGSVQKSLSNVVEKSLNKALKVSFKTLSQEGKKEKDLGSSLKSVRLQRLFHGTLAGTSGAVTGLFGGPGLVVDIPLTTTLMMRNIAAAATEFGFSHEDPKTAMECLYVFSLGTRSDNDNQFESAYYTSRAAMNAFIQKSSQFVAANSAKVVMQSLEKGSAPVLVQFVAKVASYFEIVVTQKMLAGAIPLVSSATAASVNLAFTDYFGQAAQYHFGLLALEKKYGQEAVQAAFSEK